MKSQSPRKTLHLSLKAVRDDLLYNNGNQLHREFGICFNITIFTTLNIHKLILKYAETWPEYSGDSDYPIKGYTKNYTPCYAYDMQDDMWDDSEYGKARIRLLNYLIRKTR